MKQQLLAMIKDSCLSNKVDELSGLIKESVRIKTVLSMEDNFQPWESKIGGLPALPEGVMWPQVNGRSMSFIGQFNLAEVTSMMNDPDLPRKGMLFFFYDSLRDTWINSKKGLGSWRVIYYDGKLDLLEVCSAPSDFSSIRQFRCCKVEFLNEITLPQPDSIYFEVESYQAMSTTDWRAAFPARIELDDEELSVYREVLHYLDRFYDRDRNLNRMYGHPDDLEWETQSLCPRMMNHRSVRSGLDFELEVAQWELLFQIDSDKNAAMDWYDNGRLYFWIDSTALREKKFDNVCMVVNSV